ncbi:hypothetical protein VTH82DRAFT_8620 [Thermothelomyces myriococcoides]
MSNPNGVVVGFVVLSGIFIIPLFVVWIICLVQARRQNDPARVGVAWLKAVFPLWILYLLLRVGHGSLDAALTFDYQSNYRVKEQMIQALYHINQTGDFFHRLSTISLFITFAEIAGGYIICLNPSSGPSTGRKFARGATFGWAVVLLILAISELGFAQAIITRSQEDIGYRSSLDYSRDSLSAARLAGGLFILSWLTTLSILGYGAAVVHKAKTHPFLRSGAILLLVCIVLDFLRNLINMAIYIDYTLIPWEVPRTRDFAIWFIVKPFFDNSLMFVILIMLFSLAIRKRNGFWSQPRPEWDYPGPQVMIVPAPYVMSVPVMPPQPYQQQLFPPGHGIPTIPQPVQQGQYPAPQGYYYQSQPPQELQQPPQQQQQQQQQQQELQQEPKQIEPLVQQQEQQQQEK